MLARKLNLARYKVELLAARKAVAAQEEARWRTLIKAATKPPRIPKGDQSRASNERVGSAVQT
jgi:hypothetical protein